MNLNTAKMCLDDEELFEGDKCPKCGSQIFVWVQTWIPVMASRRDSIIGSCSDGRG